MFFRQIPNICATGTRKKRKGEGNKTKAQFADMSREKKREIVQVQVCN